MDDTLVFLDAGFLSKLSKYFGSGNYLRYNLVSFAMNLAKKQNLSCKKIFYYTAAPFQSDKPSKEESERYKKYEKFVRKLSKDQIISIKEGRCQRLKINGKFQFCQKGVDSLMVIDLMTTPVKYPSIKKIIIIACDSDFVPVIKELEKMRVRTILYTYYERKDRNSIFSTSNELIKSVYKYIMLSKQDFDLAKLNKT